MTIDTSHVLFLAGYHVACIMDPREKRIHCSPHCDMPEFIRELTPHNRIHARNEYMAEVAKLLGVAS